ncbi:SRPBCC family protein [Alkalibacillus almallahensis]|uniref:SRPBCC family protein n=1 Tax=Alkalibacillus almallahensis TaxID=1379154 RepID=UPI0014232C53|nr:SRPBCC family protein [Alkalibacillus almallahensis]NIK13001.1 carbon monoxide dehydrogenase subunit G [Alkalibacillus almallahensis]
MSITFDVERTFNVSQQTAYNSLIDLDAAHHWMHGLVRMDRLDDGPIKVGSEWKETRKMFGKEASEHFEVMELQEPEKIVLRCDGSKGSTGKGEYIFTYTVDSAGDQSQVTLHGEIKGLTGLSKLFGKLMAGSFKKACAKDLDALKQYLEN